MRVAISFSNCGVFVAGNKTDVSPEVSEVCMIRMCFGSFSLNDGHPSWIFAEIQGMGQHNKVMGPFREW